MRVFVEQQQASLNKNQIYKENSRSNEKCEIIVLVGSE